MNTLHEYHARLRASRKLVESVTDSAARECLAYIHAALNAPEWDCDTIDEVATILSNFKLYITCPHAEDV